MTRSDEILIQRLLDGALSEAEAAAVRERLKAEPALRRVLGEQRSVARWFEAARAVEQRGDGPGVTPGRDQFAVRVLAAVRGGAGGAAGAEPVRFARRIALAAAFLMAVTILWALAVTDRGRGRVLDASPDELRQAVEQVERTELPAAARQTLATGRGARTQSRPAAPESPRR